MCQITSQAQCHNSRASTTTTHGLTPLSTGELDYISNIKLTFNPPVLVLKEGYYPPTEISRSRRSVGDKLTTTNTCSRRLKIRTFVWTGVNFASQSLHFQRHWNPNPCASAFDLFRFPPASLQSLLSGDKSKNRISHILDSRRSSYASLHVPFRFKSMSFFQCLYDTASELKSTFASWNCPTRLWTNHFLRLWMSYGCLSVVSDQTRSLSFLPADIWRFSETE